jgi:hypothetical protein
MTKAEIGLCIYKSANKGCCKHSQNDEKSRQVFPVNKILQTGWCKQQKFKILEPRKNKLKMPINSLSGKTLFLAYRQPPLAVCPHMNLCGKDRKRKTQTETERERKR